MPGGQAAAEALGGLPLFAAARVLHGAAQTLQVGLVGTISDLWMRFMGRCEFLPGDEERFAAWLRDTDGIRAGRPLLTVFNHHSCVDEPLVMSRAIPYSMLWMPGGVRLGELRGCEAGALPGLARWPEETSPLVSAAMARTSTNPWFSSAVQAVADSLGQAQAGETPAGRAEREAAEAVVLRGRASTEPVTRYAAPRSVVRYSVCTTEVCFGSDATSTFFNVGRAAPVLRNRTADQASMAWLQAHMDAGHWTNIFPEARTWQEGGTPLRDAEGRWSSPSGRVGAPLSGVGPFKRGVGKLVANARITPVVVPLFHQGMQDVMPQTAENDVISFMPQPGHDVTIGVGEAVDCSDLIATYHREANARARVREAARIASGERRPPPMSGHRKAMRRATEVFGSAPPAFCGIPVPPGADAVRFARDTAGGAGKAAKRAVFAAEAGAPGADDLAEMDAALGAWTGTSEEVRRWDEAWSGRVWVPTRRVKNRADAETEPAVVPTFLEGPLRARPRDFLWLSEEDAIAEHKHTLALYEAITQRIEDGMRATEARVLASRHARGVGPMPEDRA